MNDRPFSKMRLRDRALRFLLERSNVGFVDAAGWNVAFLAGSARSGTTWVEEIINYMKDYRIIFEPFWANRVAICAAFADHPYLRPSERDSRFTEPARQILRGRIRNEWTDQFTTPGAYRFRLIKDIRANLFLFWIRSQYPRLPMVLLLRHPIAVAISQLRMDWRFEISRFFNNSTLMTDFLDPFAGVEHECRDAFDRNIVHWCIENYVPLQQFRTGELLILFYEELLSDPEREFRKLFTYLGRQCDPAVLDGLDRPSAMSRRADPDLTVEQRIGAWQKEVPRAQIRRAVELLSRFNLHNIYSEDPMPDSAHAASMLADNGQRRSTAMSIPGH